jgi:hypothetical protein
VVDLDLIAKEPARARELDRDTCLDLIARAAAVHAILVASYSETAPAPPRDVNVIGTEDAARLLGLTPKALANGAAGRYKDLRVPSPSRRLAWSRSAIVALQNRGLTLGTEEPRLVPALGGNGSRRGRPAPRLLRPERGGAG